MAWKSSFSISTLHQPQKPQIFLCVSGVISDKQLWKTKKQNITLPFVRNTSTSQNVPSFLTFCLSPGVFITRSRPTHNYPGNAHTSHKQDETWLPWQQLSGEQAASSLTVIKLSFRGRDRHREEFIIGLWEDYNNQHVYCGAGHSDLIHHPLPPWTYKQQYVSSAVCVYTLYASEIMTACIQMASPVLFLQWV